jgi:hypothetical protein
VRSIGRPPASPRALAEQYDLRGLEQYDQVQKDRVILHVVQIELELLHGIVD